MRARKPKLTIPKKNQKQLETTARSRMEPVGRIQRAEILLMYAEGEKITHIAQKVNAALPLVYRAIDKALAFGALQALYTKTCGRKWAPVFTKNQQKPGI